MDDHYSALSLSPPPLTISPSSYSGNYKYTLQMTTLWLKPELPKKLVYLSPP
ncbi:hypothetical protein HanIR_Chr05g0216301 [Helianthus annuus]|nr:hypothetical protein HanIR_Chr05g0216301 [Helianthus annuus]